MKNQPQPRHIRLFLASPGDVTDERTIAHQVIENLLYDPAFVEKVTIRVIAWDKRGSETPMYAAMTPQMAITTGLPKPSDCDIVVILFWSRMGTPLPQEYYKEDGSPYLSGTEWEFNDALKASKQFGLPQILVYKRTENIMLSPTDPEFMKKYDQWQKVENFFAQFVDKESGAISMGFNRYEKPEDFRREFETHLKVVVQRIISEPINSEGEIDKNTNEDYIKTESWKGSPFPGLRAFSEEEAPIFFGRGRETDELIKKVSDTRFVAIVGVSGSGKSSLASAGLIPRLRKGAVSSDQSNSKNWNIIRFTPCQNPFEQLARALLKGVSELKGDPIEYSARKEKLANILAQSPDALSETIESAFINKPAMDELLIFIDQFEELFTLSSLELRKSFIAMLAHSVQSASLASMLVGKPAGNRIRILLTLRADFYHRCVEFPELAELLRNGSFPLAAPSQLALNEMITRPAERANLVFEKGLPDQILLDTGDEPGALALVAYTLDELYHAGKDKKRLSFEDYEALGGVRGAIGRRAEWVFARLSNPAKEMLPKIFQNLVTVDYRGIATRKRVAFEKIAQSEAAQELINSFTDARLLVQSRGESGAVVEVAHEAIFKSWKRLSDWIEETHGDLYLLEQMSRSAVIWNEHERNRDFLWLGERGHELQQVLKRLQPELTDIECAFARTEQDHLQEELQNPFLSHARRSEIGSRLHVIGDMRPGVGLRDDGLPDIFWIPIARGVISISDKSLVIKPFYISKYPITYIQYQSFIDDPDGYKNDQWWEDLPDAFKKQKLRDQLYKFNNHPRDNISWFQAVAFSNWLTGKLPKAAYPKNPMELSVEIDNKWVIRLPTEWEWQYAASCGNPDNVFPWGKEWNGQLANTQESGLQRTVAVGVYPETNASFGAVDMAGNVREWCLNEFSNIERTERNSTHPRVLKEARSVLFAIFPDAMHVTAMILMSNPAMIVLESSLPNRLEQKKMNEINLPIILASRSPRRQELLSSLGIKFSIIVPDIDEIELSGEEPEDSVRRLSREKAQSVAAQLQEPCIILSADTMVVLVDGERIKILNKPADEDHARQMLRSLRGREHFIYTGVTLLVLGESPLQITTSVRTGVKMSNFSDADLEAYLADGNPLDKAGGYAIQDQRFKLVESIEGSYTNVVGLPLETVKELFQQIGYPGEKK